MQVCPVYENPTIEMTISLLYQSCNHNFTEEQTLLHHHMTPVSKNVIERRCGWSKMYMYIHMGHVQYDHKYKYVPLPLLLLLLVEYNKKQIPDKQSTSNWTNIDTHWGYLTPVCMTCVCMYEKES